MNIVDALAVMFSNKTRVPFDFERRARMHGVIDLARKELFQEARKTIDAHAQQILNEKRRVEAFTRQREIAVVMLAGSSEYGKTCLRFTRRDGTTFDEYVSNESAFHIVRAVQRGIK